MLRGRFLFLLQQVQKTTTLLGFSQPPPTEVGSVFESLEASSRVAQLEAKIAQLKDALARRQQIGVATGLLARRFAHHQSWPGHCWHVSPRTAMSRYATFRPSSTRTTVDSAQQRSK